MNPSTPHHAKKTSFRKPWYSTWLHSLKKRMLSLFHTFKRFPTSYSFNAFFIAKKAYNKQINAAKRAFNFEEVQNLIQNACQQGIQAIYKKARPSLPSIPIDIPIFLNHCRSLFSSDSPPVFIPIPTCEVENHPLSSHFSVDEVSFGMNQAKSKACSLSGLSPFLLKSMKDSLAPLLCRVFNQCLIRSNFPSSWLESIVFFIHKKGSTSDPNNFRSISIQNPFLKLFSSLFCQRLLKFSCYQNILPTFQFGFRPNRSTV